jgi:hypothetical protein
MNILAQLPEDIKQKVFLYLAHPCADMIGDEVERLHLDKVIALAVEGVDLEIKLDLREFFSVEYFTAYNFYKHINPLKIIHSYNYRLSWLVCYNGGLKLFKEYFSCII